MENKIYNAVNLIILNNENKIFLMKRSSTEDVEPNKWCIPGGTVEKFESYEEALNREVKEEVGSEIITYKYFKSYYVDIIQPVRVAYFIGKINEEKIKLNEEEASDFGWFFKDEIKNLEVAFNQKEVLDDFFNNGKQ